jgi:hypothetical protein
LVGAWKDFEEIETSLSLPELEAILEAARKRERDRQRFQAALKGVNLDADTEESLTGDDIKRRVEAKMRGMSEEQFELQEIGIAIQEE